MLWAALNNRIPGTNLLLPYGPPGVGKTEYAAVLAGMGADGTRITPTVTAIPSGERRLRAFNLGQRLLARRDNALLFDEVEDVFERNPFARLFGEEGDNATAGKA
ncbi:MAG: hypothetical protein U1F42_03165 [Candidatus Competibacteraceae bacterium]